ncbi:TPA: hypothetical protein ACJG8Q_003625 [Salmonella enterica subsp. diarizonae serovar 61:i:z]
MALASCAVGDSYCSKAMSDLAGKNQTVADTVTALTQSETWSAVADTVKEAAVPRTESPVFSASVHRCHSVLTPRVLHHRK